MGFVFTYIYLYKLLIVTYSNNIPQTQLIIIIDVLVFAKISLRDIYSIMCLIHNIPFNDSYVSFTRAADEGLQALSVQRVDNAIHRINHYPLDSVACFVDIWTLDNDLSSG